MDATAARVAALHNEAAEVGAPTKAANLPQMYSEVHMTYSSSSWRVPFSATEFRNTLSSSMTSRSVDSQGYAAKHDTAMCSLTSWVARGR
eukprot:10803329-Alexandrium_andersonii.AAC.1